MNLNAKFLFLLSLIFSFSSVLALAESDDEKGSSAEVEASYGHALNPARAPGGFAGSYFRFKPKWEHLHKREGGYLLKPMIEGEIKKFNDEKVAASSDVGVLTAGFQTSKFTESSWELALLWLYEYAEGRIAPTDFELSFGEPLSYTQQLLNLSATYWPEPFAFTIGTKFRDRKYLSPLYDEQDNPFYDDYRDLGIYAKVVIKTFEHMNFEVGGDWNDKRYSKRPARGEWGISQPTGPLLHLWQDEYYFAIIPTFETFEMLSLVGIGRDLDLTNGISTVKKTRLVHRMCFFLNKDQTLSFEPEIDILTRNFLFVRSDLSSPEAAATSDLRRDVVTAVSAALKFGVVENLDFLLKAGFFDSDSNFVDEDYFDRFFEAGLVASF